MKLVLSLAFFILYIVPGLTQDQPVYNQFYFNPYLYNPGFVGNNGKLEANFTYKKQWIDNSDAPTVSAFNIQYANEGNIALGASFQSQSAVALTTNTAYFTFAYRIRFSELNYLKFGLSAGVLQNNLDLDEISLTSDSDIFNDPALIGVVDNTLYMSGQFGMQLTLDRLTIGIALPRLFNNDANSTDDFNTPEFDQFNQFIASASYEARLSPIISLQPLLLYRHVSSEQYQAEASILTSYKNIFWVGAGYRYDASIIGHMGLNVRDMFSFAYSYSPGFDELQSLGGNHEITLKLRLDKKNRNPKSSQNEPMDFSDVVDTKPDDLKAPPPQEEEVAIEPTKIMEESVSDDPEEDLPEVQPPLLEEPRVVHEYRDDTGIAPGHYVVVGVFSVRSNAERLKDEIEKSYSPAFVVFNKKNSYYYVYLVSSDEFEPAKNKLKTIRSSGLFDFNNAWILNVN